MEIAATDDKKKYTYDDYIRMDDENRYEVVEGELLFTPSPGFKHQDVVRRLAGLLSAWIEGQNLGAVIMAPFDVVLARDIVLQPDIVYLDFLKWLKTSRKIRYNRLDGKRIHVHL